MAEIRVNASGALKLYDSDDSNYVSFKSAGTVSSDVTWTLPSADGSDGQALTTDGSGTLSWATASSADPSSADGDSLGTASAEWSDLYLADGGIIYFGNDQDINITHVADTGLTTNGTITANAGLKADNITIDGTEIDLSSGDLTLDVAGDIYLNADGGDIIFQDGSATTGKISYSGGNMDISSDGSDNDIVFKGNDGGSAVTALTIDMSAGGELLQGDSAKISSNGAIANFTNHNGSATETALGTSDGNEKVRCFNDGKVTFETGGSERCRLDPHLKYNKTDVAVGTAGFHIQQSGSDANSAAITAASTTPFQVNRLTNDGQLVALRQDSTEHGSIDVSGSTVAYNTFCGTHWSRLADNSKPTILRGTVMESIATMMTWYQVEYTKTNTDENGKETSWVQRESISLPDGKSVGDNHTITVDGVEYTGKIIKEDNEQLPMCKISDTADSKAVYGVFLSWDDADDGLDDDVNDMRVASLGAFVVRIHKDETVAIGNWLVSKGDGTAKVLAGNTAITADVQSSIIGKVTSTEKTHTHADSSYCVPCTLHCG